MVPIVGAKDLLLGQWLVEQCFGCSELFRSVKIPIRCWHFSIHVPMFHERVFVGRATMCGCAQSKRMKARKRTKQSEKPTTMANNNEPTTTSNHNQTTLTFVRRIVSLRRLPTLFFAFHCTIFDFVTIRPFPPPISAGLRLLKIRSASNGCLVRSIVDALPHKQGVKNKQNNINKQHKVSTTAVVPCPPQYPSKHTYQ